MDVEVLENTPECLCLCFTWHIFPKKNWKRAFRWIVLPSENYCERHKRMTNKLKWVVRNFNSFPCSLDISSIAESRVKSDIDNQATSIMDLLTDLWVIEDDNRFIISKLTIEHKWYVKWCPLTLVTLLSYQWDLLDIDKRQTDIKSFINNLK